MAAIHALFTEATQHYQAGRLTEVEALCRQILERDPDHADSFHLLGMAAQQFGRDDLAIGLFGQAIGLNANAAPFYSNLGNSLFRLDRLDDALACHGRALELAPELGELHNNRGTVLVRQRRMAEAADCFRTALACQGGHQAVSHYNLSMALLAQGDFAAGWPEWEWRRDTPEGMVERRDFPQPQWRGEPAVGARLLVHAEQGLGDSLLFCRYASLAAQRGLRVTLEVQASLVRLLRRLAGVEQVVARGDALPAFDLQCPMASLPLAFGTLLPSAIAYLSAEPAAAAVWRRRLAQVRGPRVGLAWAGNPQFSADARRSLPPALLAPLFDVPGVHFFSLQKDNTAVLPLTDAMDEMTDLADTAALVANLDLVITVDSAVAHLAAALGRPVWLMDRFDACWRWFLGRRDSPWYPTLKIYRQPKPGDWDAVLSEIASDLGRWSAGLSATG